MRKTIKDILQKAANLLGYRIEKIRESGRPYVPIDILDLVVRDHMSKTEDFFVLQIGANDGVRVDPIRRYIKEFHWSGLLVEPVPWLFEKLCENYKDEHQLRFENAAIAAHDGTVTFYAVVDEGGFPDFAHGLGTLDRESILSPDNKSRIPNIESLIREIVVPSMTVATLLAKHQVEWIDLLQIDAEGYDFEILKMFDFGKMKPSIIQFEHFHLPIEERNECFRYLASNGYRLATVYGDTIAYLQNDN